MPRAVFRVWFVATVIVVAPPSSAGQTVRAPGVDSLAVRAIVQSQFNTTSVEGEDEPDSEWLIRRARIGIRAHVAGWIAAYVEGDFGRGTARLTDG
ncbi:MAG TPA: hypothetical protein VM737_08225, partial [Gemmatimonadota bacterium]|nr:hypothetical protein [Gemmatimonadota bacterium]